MSKWKVNKMKISLIRDNKRPGEISSVYHEYKETEITSALIDEVGKLLLQGKIKRIEVNNIIDHIGMSIVVDGQKSQIGIVDEMNDVVYYYSNGSQSQRNVDLGGYTFKEWMICTQPETMLSMLLEFIDSGKKLETVFWASEEI